MGSLLECSPDATPASNVQPLAIRGGVLPLSGNRPPHCHDGRRLIQDLHQQETELALPLVRVGGIQQHHARDVRQVALGIHAQVQPGVE